ncbi:N-terminal cleavage protein [Opitutaceae bacterium TAV5]|nr:N-terminal cleavage protein [Opitutaceae bacterium TAV5]
MHPEPLVTSPMTASCIVRRPASATSGGFTLIELLTVIAIIGILSAIIIPTVGKVRETARLAQCKSNLRTLQQGVILYANDNKGNYPYGDSAIPGMAVSSNIHWQRKISPYVSGPSPVDWYTSLPIPGVYLCPSDTRPYPNKVSPPDSRGGMSYGVNHKLAPGMNANAITNINTLINNPVSLFDAIAPTGSGNNHLINIPDSTEKDAFERRHNGKYNYARMDGSLQTFQGEIPSDSSRPDLWLVNK